jgi:predicted HTH domain antitoxin
MSFTVRLELPPEVEERIRKEKSDIAEDVKEAYAVELFRRGKLSHYESSSVPGLSRSETDAYLKLHKVFEGSLTSEDVESDYQTLRQLHLKNP